MGPAFAGYIIGGVTGCTAGLLLGLSARVRAAARPSARAVSYLIYVALGLALPRTSSLIQGISLTAVATGALTLGALAELADQYWELAHHFGAGPAGLVQTIALPGAGLTILRRILAAAIVVILAA